MSITSVDIISCHDRFLNFIVVAICVLICHHCLYTYNQRDWGKLVVPDFWPEAAPRTPITTIDWMREAEIKHGRIAMLAVVGWIAVDYGLRAPGVTESVAGSLAAHKWAVENGSMGVLLNFVAICELMSGAAIYDASRGSGRQPGEFSFDPLNFGKDAKTRERYATNEVKNGRLAMLAISGILTQAALFPDKTFPYF